MNEHTGGHRSRRAASALAVAAFGAVSIVAGGCAAEESAAPASVASTRGLFDFTIDTAGASAGRAELRLWEPSARDGSDVNVVTIPLELTG